MRMSQSTSGVRRIALTAIFAHAIVASLHGAAHQTLAVGLTRFQTIFIATVIVTAPIAAGVLLWKRIDVAGGILLAASMSGSLVFGLYYHFIESGSDNVSHVSALSPAIWATVFQATALLLLLTEAFGIYAGMRALKTSLAE